MAEGPVETVYGRDHKYEIFRQRYFLATKFVIHRDGSRWRGEFKSLSQAIESAREAG